jgi:glycosyltransferase involved in cell wall biosynthesis
MHMSQAFAKLGHEVTLFTAQNLPDIEPGIDDDYGFYGVDKVFEIRKILLDESKQRHFNHASQAVSQIRSIADLIYTRSLPAVAASIDARISLIYEAHMPLTRASELRQKVFLKYSRHKLFKRLVTITSAIRDDFLSCAPWLEEKSIVAPSASEPVPEGIQPKILPIANRLKVGYVGSLNAGKGLEVVLPLARSHPNFDFHVVGGGRNINPDMDAGIENNLFFHGYQPPFQTAAYVQGFDIALLPNQKHVMAHGGNADIGDWTSPVKMFEYMAAGKPIIASDLPVIKEILENGINALLCDPEDLDAWSEALDLLASDASLRERLGRNAYRQFQDHYSYDMRARHVLG